MSTFIPRYSCANCGSRELVRSECVIEDCDGIVYARGWCKKHYQTWWRNGDPEVPDQRKTRGDSTLLEDDSFWDRVDATTEQRIALRAS